MCRVITTHTNKNPNYQKQKKYYIINFIKGEIMKIKNNSIIHQVKDIVKYKNNYYDIIKIDEDLVWLSELKKPVNIFKIKIVKWVKTNGTR
jgi:hypothetical protein